MPGVLQGLGGAQEVVVVGKKKGGHIERKQFVCLKIRTVRIKIRKMVSFFPVREKQILFMMTSAS